MVGVHVAQLTLMWETRICVPCPVPKYTVYHSCRKSAKLGQRRTLILYENLKISFFRNDHSIHVQNLEISFFYVQPLKSLILQLEYLKLDRECVCRGCDSFLLQND